MSKENGLIKFLPSYVGSKKSWIKHLNEYKNENFVELFCGSGVLSANLAKTAILNDLDHYVWTILSNFDQLIVSEIFTKEDYFKYRGDKEWWKYIYCFQKMSFSGVFRYSKNGYNVPIKDTINSVSLKEDYQKALNRWKELSPLVSNKSYDEIPVESLKNKVVIFDPPYEGSQASYNFKFDYNKYWNYVNSSKEHAKVMIVFDRASNLEKQNIPVFEKRKMRVNGSKAGDFEGMAIYQNGGWLK